jgi:hypothetical protein
VLPPSGSTEPTCLTVRHYRRAARRRNRRVDDVMCRMIPAWMGHSNWDGPRKLGSDNPDIVKVEALLKGENVLLTVALNRQFSEWHEGGTSDPDFIWRWRSDDLLSWESISDRRRVVILAEAGSGKTVEMREQARRRTEAGEFGFYATVEDVGRDGLDGALAPGDRARLVSWRGKSNESAWFFVDSVDEAKLSGIRLERAIRRIAEGIAGNERRAHVILSGRLTDWEFRRDLERLAEGLPVPKDTVLPPPPTAEEVLISTLRHERPQPQVATAEGPLVVLMAALDRDRVKLFAAAKHAPNVDAFLAQIETANLWRFARRPLDLDWLVDFWQSQGRLGSLAEMLENSLTARVRETNLDRAQGDALDETRALQAIERIGAALVFGRKSTIAIPDSELVLSKEESLLDLAPVLPEWSPEDRMRLLTRPVFDPATFGRARLHNDNVGVVRGYLTARWLHRLRQKNLSLRDLFELLFATTYGIDLIKPSMQETAAWLAIWDEEVAREVIRRDPSLPLTAGDPASLSTSVREVALTNVIELLATGDQHLRILEHDSVKRFARPDLGNIIRTLWSRYHAQPEARRVLLQLIWLGELRDCADVAETAFETYPDRFTRIFAGRARASAGDDAAKRRYAKFIKDNCEGLPSALVWDAIGDLFPDFLDVGDLLAILSVVDISDADGGLSFEGQSPGLVERLDARPELEQLLRGLLSQLGDDRGDIGHIPDKREEAYFVAIAAAACRLLEQCEADEAPTDTIDAALELGRRRRYHHSIHEVRDIAAELHRSATRRRLAFWRTAERLSGDRMLQGRRIEHPWEMEVLGYPPKLPVEDIAWLLADASGRSAENERRLAINTSMQLWRQANEPSDILSEIERTTRSDAAMRQAYDIWLNPPPQSPELVAQHQQMKEITQRAEAQRAARDQSWLEFIDRLRKDPDQLRRVRPPTAEGADTRVYHLWQLLTQTVDSSSRYAIDSIAPLEPMLGAEAAAALRDAIMQHWRLWRPRLKSTKVGSERNQMSSMDCMGITGVSLEARARPRWAERLSSDEAILAASYATLEINGFPSWLSELAAAKPTEVRRVLVGEIAAELDGPKPRDRYDALEDVSRADKPIIELMAPALFDELERRDDLTAAALAPMLSIIAPGLRENRQQFVQLAIDRFNNAVDAHVRALYLGSAFAVDSATAMDALMARLDTLGVRDQTALVERMLPSIFGTGFRDMNIAQPDISFETLERLVAIAFRTIRTEDDHNRRSGEVFSPDARDNAEHARSAAFNQLMAIPGRATFDALLRLAENPDCPITKPRLHELAGARAAQDSESAPWLPAETIAFEQTAETAPSTAKDLQRVALRRLEDMQHELLHGDFAQGVMVKALPKETAVQNWVADRLRLKQGRAYSVEREPHVADEKEPDVRLRAKVTDASLAIEIKVPEKWKLKALEEALTDQLCGRYLRAQDARYGILLLVYKKPRPKGWKDTKTGAVLKFSQVVDRLRDLAARIAGTGPDAPQPEIAVLDVTSCGTST